MDERRTYPIENFDPLLRDLVAWGLVIPSEMKTKTTWRLTDAAQQRLNQIVRHRGPLSADHMVYLDRLCADCHFRGRTRLYEGLYLCDACLKVRVAPVPEPASSDGRWPWRRHRHEVDGIDPLTHEGSS